MGIPQLILVMKRSLRVCRHSLLYRRPCILYRQLLGSLCAILGRRVISLALIQLCHSRPMVCRDSVHRRLLRRLLLVYLIHYRRREHQNGLLSTLLMDGIGSLVYLPANQVGRNRIHRY